MIIPECMNEWLPLNGWMSDYPYMDECILPLNGWINDYPWIDEWMITPE